MNNLGGMVFIVAGIALGYWVLTGRAVKFMQALNAGTPTNLQGFTPDAGQAATSSSSSGSFSTDSQAPGTTQVIPFQLMVGGAPNNAGYGSAGGW